MRLLVLGGSWFLGRTIVEAALSQGWDVTSFRRGKTGHSVPGVKLIKGDREDPDSLRNLAKQGPWDAVIDTSGFVPRVVLETAKALETVASRYVFISTVSVYEGWPISPLTEISPVLECPYDAGEDFGFEGDPGPSMYGFQKAGAETAVKHVFGEAATTVIRPGVILGPYEYVGRLPWWLRRVERGGKILAPGNPGRSIQPIDVRDVAQFAAKCAGGLPGTFNATAEGHDTFNDFLTSCKEVTKSDATFEWVAEDLLIEHGVKQWTEIPLWRTYAGAWNVDSSNARAAGLTCRPITETVSDTWEWLTANGSLVEHERQGEQGIAPEKEARILAEWASKVH
ncbi:MULTISPECIES: NAD-dependent epimerase/dehydratase family protein [unclassified Crossiella]|uniref:NAD-dependent epimerase/dehydratase family protein n=1 Tax=unclassified Crossiella TaxID=2620835 RepID=UPI001FFF0A14|nr:MULTISPECIES: NAD-dependent epimerase/dehydratase family protein [unclassified Crossiella]MCK2237159.1 NAD-dependent epimerase/dehydratase family protein [Crossiella sp. S99.2]MCK2252530.1 NAD-dependent epimerase/dehydratase family protein [Crossiella sp. S99.1]